MCMLCALHLMNMVEHGMMRANDMLTKHEHVGMVCEWDHVR